MFSFSLLVNAFAILPARLPDGAVGFAYSQTFTTAGGAPPMTFSLAAGQLPPGLNLSPGGSLSGTPTSAGVSRFTVRATDSNLVVAENAYTLWVLASCDDLNPCTDDSYDPSVGCVHTVSGTGSCTQRVDAGGDHTCGVRTDGALACWGSNSYGQSSPPTGTFTVASAGGDQSSLN